MLRQETFVIKLFYFSFILDKPKLSRLFRIAENKYKTIVDKPLVTYNITLKNSKVLSSSDIDHIFDQDNTIKNPIDNLAITYKDKEGKAENVCTLVFNREDSEVMIEVRSQNGRFANELFAELEEQVERTEVHNLIYKIKKGNIFQLTALAVSLITLMIFVTLTLPGKKFQSNNFLKDHDINELHVLASSASDQAKKIDFVYEFHRLQLANVAKAQNTVFRVKADIRLILVLVPGLIVLGALVYVFVVCYPGSVFLWGDCETHYNTLVARRKFVWNAIVLALLVGVIGNLFVYGLSQYWPSR
ncbi:MAG: hypothetical protein AUK23_07830 [Deltaproteobacteria bacterium CG2_30_43_15]|nr:MAG: hypothetical protein AUK23_07830 [Deltaproteobacteria bacterium CG2_30_43_15]